MHDSKALKKLKMPAEALRRERYPKTGKGRDELRRILQQKDEGSA